MEAGGWSGPERGRKRISGDRPERRREQRHGFFRPIRGAGIKRAGDGGSAAAGCGGEKREASGLPQSCWRTATRSAGFIMRRLGGAVPL